MRTGPFSRILPSWQSACLSVLAALLLILAFPDFGFWYLAWFALAPLMWAVDREKHCVSVCFVLGWMFGFLFFSGTCWWLTYAPIHYAGFPWPLAYFLLFCVTGVAGLFPAIFAALLAVLLRRYGSRGFLAAPFVWVFTEFLRYWVTGNNWNAAGYSQAFHAIILRSLFAPYGGVLLVGFFLLAVNGSLTISFVRSQQRFKKAKNFGKETLRGFFPGLVASGLLYVFFLVSLFYIGSLLPSVELPAFSETTNGTVERIIAVQPNVPMSGLDRFKWEKLRAAQIAAAETELTRINEHRTTNSQPVLVILPESPMNFMYEDDREFSSYINDFARRNNVSVLFNSSEPDIATGKYFNSAVMVGPDGRKMAEYDKMFLLPFGEAVPGPFAGLVPAFVGTFAYGSKYSLLPVGDAKAGVMICFESHFGQLSREYVRNGADVIIEMTNDGYLGPTPVLRQHLANAVFRAVETNRPVLRVTNVGITAYINEDGQVLDPAPTYTEATRTWAITRSDGSQTFYVKYGDWFAWLCSVVTIALLLLSLRRTSGITDN